MLQRIAKMPLPAKVAVLVILAIPAMLGFVKFIQGPPRKGPAPGGGGGKPNATKPDDAGRDILPEDQDWRTEFSPKVQANTTRLLQKLGGAKTAAARRRYIENIDAESLAEVQRAVIRNIAAEGDATRAAIAAARYWRLADAVPELQNVAHWGKGEARADAVRAAEELDPWSANELGRFLTDDEGPVIVATLEICARRPDRPVSEIVDLLRHELGEVRDAAVAAIPSETHKPGVGDALVAFSKRASGSAAVAAARALGRVGATDVVTKRLCQLVGSSDWQVRRAALESLLARREPLPDVAPVLAAAGDARAPLLDRSRALLVMERSGSVPLGVVRLAEMGHPLLRLHAARCLVSQGHEAAALFLVQLLATRAGPGLDQDLADRIALGAHAVLVEISGGDYGLDEDAWRRWALALDSLPQRRLRVAPPSLR